MTPPKLGNKQLDSEPESADKTKKHPDQRNNFTPQLFIADLKTSREVQKRMPSRAALQQGDGFLFYGKTIT